MENFGISYPLMILYSKSSSAAGRTGCRNAKVTRALTGRSPVRPAADYDFEIML